MRHTAFLSPANSTWTLTSESLKQDHEQNDHPWGVHAIIHRDTELFIDGRFIATLPQSSIVFFHFVDGEFDHFVMESCEEFNRYAEREKIIYKDCGCSPPAKKYVAFHDDDIPF